MTTEELKTLQELENRFIFATEKIQADMLLGRIIKLLPNDYDLGGYVRNLYENKLWK